MKKKALPLGGAPDPFPCFACGKPMTMLSAIGWCEGCDVLEEHADYVSHIKAVPSARWCGVPVTYIDHSREHCPSPA